MWSDMLSTIVSNSTVLCTLVHYSTSWLELSAWHVITVDRRRASGPPGRWLHAQGSELQHHGIENLRFHAFRTSSFSRSRPEGLPAAKVVLASCEWCLSLEVILAGQKPPLESSSHNMNFTFSMSIQSNFVAYCAHARPLSSHRRSDLNTANPSGSNEYLLGALRLWISQNASTATVSGIDTVQKIQNLEET